MIETASSVLAKGSLYIGSGDGLMPRERRPKLLRASILGRVPPSDSTFGFAVSQGEEKTC